MRLGSAARDGHLRKLRGFYVDYRDGTILSPGQVTAAGAQQIVDGARRGGSRDWPRARLALLPPGQLVQAVEQLPQRVPAGDRLAVLLGRCGPARY